MASAASRSVSWPRMWATPRRWLVPSARAATAATTGVSSLAADRSRSIPCRWSVPRTVRPCSSKLGLGPEPIRMSRIASPGCSVDPGQCGTVTAPPVIAAAARNTAAFDRSGSIVSSSGVIGPGATTQRSGSESSIRTCRSRSIATVISRWGREGIGGPAWRRSRPPRKAGADHQQGADELAGGWTRRPSARRLAPGTPRRRSREGQGAAGRRPPWRRGGRASSSGAIGRAYACSSPSKRTGPSASRAHGGRKRITVPASPQSTVTLPVKRGRGSDLPLVTGLGDLHPERPQRRPASVGCRERPGRC